MSPEQTRDGGHDFFRLGNGAGRAAQVEEETESPLTFGEDLLRLLARGDIGAGPDPFTNRALRVEHRYAAHEEEAINSIRPAQAILDLVEVLARDAIGPAAQGRRSVLRMNAIGPAHLEGLLHRLPGVGAPRGQIFQHLSGGIGLPDDLRGCLGKAAETLDASLKLLGRKLALGNVLRSSFVVEDAVALAADHARVL